MLSFKFTFTSVAFNSGETFTYPAWFHLIIIIIKLQICVHGCMKMLHSASQKANTQRFSSADGRAGVWAIRQDPLMKTLSVKITQDECILARVRGCRCVWRHRSDIGHTKSGGEVEEPVRTARAFLPNTIRRLTYENKNLLATRCYAVRERVLQRESSRPLSTPRMEPEVQRYGFPVKSHSWCGSTCQGQRIPACRCKEIPGYACF